MQPIKAIIFDLDGVLVDTARFHYKAWKKLAHQLDIDFGQQENEQLKGVSRVDSLKKILSWGDKTLPPEEFNRLMKAKNDDYLVYVNQITAEDLLPGVAESLQFLTAKQIPFALGSASKNARRILDKLALTATFKAIVDGTNVSKAKPDPQVFLKAAELLEVAPEHCAVFEDSIAGIQAANAANMRSIGIGRADVLHEADYIFSDFTTINTTTLTSLIKGTL